MKRLIIIMCMVIVFGTIITAVLYVRYEGFVRAYEPESIEELVETSDLIIVGEAGDKFTKVMYGDKSYYKTKVFVIKSIGGHIVGDEIYLLQERRIIDPRVRSGSELLLFLDKYEEGLNLYMCNGLYDGHYIIVDGIVTPSTKESRENLFIDSDGFNVENLTKESVISGIIKILEDVSLKE